MKSKLILILGGIIAILLATIGILCSIVRTKTNLAETYRSNTEVLMSDIEEYRVRDSLNAVKVGALELNIRELEKYRAEDAQMIRDLKVSKKELTALVSIQSNTIREIEGKLKDSSRIRIVDSLVVSYDSVKTMSYHDKFLDLDFVINADGTFDGSIETRENLTIVEETKYKRFLGFLWRTNKVESTNVSAVSDNPYTKIVGAEYIKIRK